MGRGNPGVLTSLARRLTVESEGGWGGWRDGSRADRKTDTAPHCATCDLKENKLGGKKSLVVKWRDIYSQFSLFGRCGEMNLILGALSALVYCSSSSSQTLDPAGRNVCHRYILHSPSHACRLFIVLLPNDDHRSHKLLVGVSNASQIKAECCDFSSLIQESDPLFLLGP